MTRFLKAGFTTGCIGVALSAAVPCEARSVFGANVQTVFAQEGNAFMVQVDKAVGGTATSCGTTTNNYNRFAIDPSTPGGKAMISTVLMAASSGRKIDIVGRGEFPGNFTDFCNVWSDVESVNYLDLAQ